MSKTKIHSNYLLYYKPHHTCLKQPSLYCVHDLLARNSSPYYMDTFSVLHGTKCGYCEAFMC